MKAMTLASFSPQPKQPEMDMGPIKLVLGQDAPDITPTQLGRLRLVTALKNKFGASYRNVPAASQALSHFDSELRYFQTLRKIKGTTNA